MTLLIRIFFLTDYALHFAKCHIQVRLLSNDQDSFSAKKKMTPNDISTFFCCMRMCAVALSVTTVEMTRQTFQAMKKMDRSQYILNWIRDHSRRISVFLTYYLHTLLSMLLHFKLPRTLTY
jgi:hypothetical protein